MIPLTANEWKVVIAAVAVFVIVNIIMWTLIIKSKRRSKANSEGPSMEGLPESIKTSPKKSKAPAPSPDEFSIPADRKPPEDFKLIDNIIIVHTDERIKI